MPISPSNSGRATKSAGVVEHGRFGRDDDDAQSEPIGACFGLLTARAGYGASSASDDFAAYFCHLLGLFFGLLDRRRRT